MTGRISSRSLSLSLGSLLVLFVLSGQAAAQEQRDCSDFSTQEEAQEYYDDRSDDDPNDPDPDDLDTDGDGQACEGLPASAQATGSPAPAASPSANELPQNGAETGIIALSGLSLLEAGYGLTLASKRLGIRRRSIPLYLMRRMINAAELGSDRVAISDDVYLVHRSALESAPFVDEEAFAPESQAREYDYVDLADEDDEDDEPLVVETNGHAKTAGPAVYAALARRGALNRDPQ